MIKNLWKQTAFLCANHQKPILMEPYQGPRSTFYRCPEYVKKYIGQKGCPNRLSPEHAEGILQKLSEYLEESSRERKELNITGYTFHYKYIECKVIHHSQDRFLISIKNRQAMK